MIKRLASLTAVATLLLIASKNGFASNPVAVSETGIFFVGTNCEFYNHEIGPLTNRSLEVGPLQFLQARFNVRVACYARDNGIPFEMRQVDVLTFPLTDFVPRQRAWYAPNGTAVAWYEFETNTVILNPRLQFDIWSSHTNEHLSYAIELNWAEGED